MSSSLEDVGVPGSGGYFPSFLALPGVAALNRLAGRRRRGAGEVNRWNVSSWEGEKKPPSLFHLTAASRRLFHLILSKLQGGVQFEEQ